MNIVLEGVDASGKSSLAHVMSRALRMHVVAPQGREKYAGEMIERAQRYLTMDGVIFDRHPCVSDPIYRSAEGKASTIHPNLMGQFYNSDTIIVYCDATTKRANNPHGGYDSPEHLEMVDRNYMYLLRRYREWALQHANIVYRIGDDMQRTIRMAADFDPFGDVGRFHTKYGQEYVGKPRSLTTEELLFRYAFICEEGQEYNTAALAALRELALPKEGGLVNREDANLVVHLADQLDALVDLAYVTLGTAYMQGFDFRAAWRRVQQANMKKVRVESAAKSARGSALDVVKPEGWVAPDHSDLVEDNEHRSS